MILWNQFWGVGPSAHDSGFPRRRRVSAEGEKIILCIILCVFGYLARTFVSHVPAQLFHMWISTAFILMQSFCHWCHSRFGHQGPSFSIHRLARHYHWVLKYFGVRKKKGFILKKVRSHWCKQKCSQSAEERALQPARLWPGFKEEVESELSQEPSSLHRWRGAGMHAKWGGPRNKGRIVRGRWGDWVSWRRKWWDRPGESPGAKL